MSNEINTILFPQQIDGVNWITVDSSSSLDDITEVITRNANAIIRIETVLGINRDFTDGRGSNQDRPIHARLETLEYFFKAGEVNLQRINIISNSQKNILIANSNGVTIGDENNSNYFALNIYATCSCIGNLSISGVLQVNSSANKFYGSSASNPILTVENENNNYPALKVVGNILVAGKIQKEGSSYGLISHNDLSDVLNSGKSGHVTDGDAHNHTRGAGAQLDHNNLLNISTVGPNAIHVTNGDAHTHSAGDGGRIRHSSLLLDDVLHVNMGNQHTHSGNPTDGGGQISHFHLANIGFYTHSDLDNFIDYSFKEHLSRIDPTAAQGGVTAELKAYQNEAFHVPLGHVSDPNAHHAKHTNDDIINGLVTVSKSTATYAEGNNYTIQQHIQAIGNGIITAQNPHGMAAKDISALEDISAIGSVSDSFKNSMLLYYDTINHANMVKSDGTPIHDYQSAQVETFNAAFSDGILGSDTAFKINFSSLPYSITIGSDDCVFIAGRRYIASQVKVLKEGRYVPYTEGLIASFEDNKYYCIYAEAVQNNGDNIVCIKVSSALSVTTPQDALANADASFLRKGNSFPLYVVLNSSSSGIVEYDRRLWGIWRSYESWSNPSTEKFSRFYDTTEYSLSTGGVSSWQPIRNFKIIKPYHRSKLTIKYKLKVIGTGVYGFALFVLGRGNTMRLEFTNFYAPELIPGGINLEVGMTDSDNYTAYSCECDLSYCTPGEINIFLWLARSDNSSYTFIKDIEMYFS